MCCFIKDMKGLWSVLNVSILEAKFQFPLFTKTPFWLGIVVHAFDPSTSKSEAVAEIGESL